ncbi:hypothetical protein OGAPHI_003381 [Ogataea philodendri]|uniref:Uncharacterized protein n=1 Tax=Ogataea philodendri TaxID=1378263 RepID=A0A9P8T5M5_9ASCO|nr:uncharacterized protein OGAPHI_003381 [Ogataea philodendri]KAH3666931.1 hypothetical protein OGAPHI_003381 [Ogataea philodendri]
MWNTYDWSHYECRLHFELDRPLAAPVDDALAAKDAAEEPDAVWDTPRTELAALVALEESVSASWASLSSTRHSQAGYSSSFKATGDLPVLNTLMLSAVPSFTDDCSISGLCRGSRGLGPDRVEHAGKIGAPAGGGEPGWFCELGLCCEDSADLPFSVGQQGEASDDARDGDKDLAPEERVGSGVVHQFQSDDLGNQVRQSGNNADERDGRHHVFSGPNSVCCQRGVVDPVCAENEARKEREREHLRVRGDKNPEHAAEQTHEQRACDGDVGPAEFVGNVAERRTANELGHVLHGGHHGALFVRQADGRRERRPLHLVPQIGVLGVERFARTDEHDGDGEHGATNEPHHAQSPDVAAGPVDDGIT